MASQKPGEKNLKPSRGGWWAKGWEMKRSCLGCTSGCSGQSSQQREEDQGGVVCPPSRSSPGASQCPPHPRAHPTPCMSAGSGLSMPVMTSGFTDSFLEPWDSSALRKCENSATRSPGGVQGPRKQGLREAHSHPLPPRPMFSRGGKRGVTLRFGMCVRIDCVKIPRAFLVLIYHGHSSSDFKRTKAVSSIKSEDSFEKRRVPIQ